MAIFGVDVHPNFQPNFDFRGAASEGYRFAFVKASQGDTGVPPGFDAYFARADAAMDVVGFYHFLDSTMTGARQAEMYVDVVRRNGGSQDRLLAVDFEPYAGGDPTNAHLLNFVNRVKAQTNDHPMICYTTRNYWNSGQPTGDPSGYGIDVMWEATVWFKDERREAPKAFYFNSWKPWYQNQPRLVYPSAPTLLRQYTWGGHVGGLYVDTDAFEGDLADLKKLTRR